MGRSKRGVNAARCKAILDSDLSSRYISTLQVCAKGPGEACGGPYNSAGKCGNGLRRGSNSLFSLDGEASDFLLLNFVFETPTKKC